MTNPALLVNRILKELTATEDAFYGGYVNTKYLLSMTQEDADEEQQKLFRLEGSPCWLANSDPASEAVDVDTTPPWWLACNPKRFPYWFGKPDPRNRGLVLALQRIKNFNHQSFYSHLITEVPTNPLCTFFFKIVSIGKFAKMSTSPFMFTFTF